MEDNKVSEKSLEKSEKLIKDLDGLALRCIFNLLDLESLLNCSAVCKW